MNLPLRSELKGLVPYGAPQLDVPVRLNTNENPYSPPAALVSAIATAVAEIAPNLNRYPDRDAIELRKALTEYLNQEADVSLTADRLWAANGSNEVMLQILQTFGGPGHTALTFAPTYSMYEEYARDTNTQFVSVPRLPDFSLNQDLVVRALAEHRPSVVFFASPNNPTGTAMDLGLIEAVLRSAPNTVIVVDEAYAEFRRPGVKSAATLLDKYPNLIVSRTMSKAFAFAGLRLGYIATSAEIIANLMLVRLPYHLSSLTQTVAVTALKFAKELQQDLAKIRNERDQLIEWFQENGYETAESDANFVMFGSFENPHQVWQNLVDRGVLVREVGPAGWLRVTIGTAAEMKIFQKALLETKAVTV